MKGRKKDQLENEDQKLNWTCLHLFFLYSFKFENLTFPSGPLEGYIFVQVSRRDSNTQ